MDDDEKYSQLIQKDMQTLEGEKGTLRYDVDDYRDKLVCRYNSLSLFASK